MDKLNQKIGKRLKKILREANMSQKELAKATGYTPQYISSLVMGKKKLSSEAARNIAKSLSIRKEYLLCIDDYKTDKQQWDKRHRLFDERESILESLINQAGYRRVCDYIANFKELGLDHLVHGPFIDDEDFVKYMPDEILEKINLYTVIETPNGKRFACSCIDYSLLEYELVEFIHFRFKQLESRFAWEVDDGWRTCQIFKGSITKKYAKKDVSQYPDITSSSIWVDHNDEMPPIGYYDWEGRGYSGYYDDRKGRWTYENSENFVAEEIQEEEGTRPANIEDWCQSKIKALNT